MGLCHMRTKQYHSRGFWLSTALGLALFAGVLLWVMSGIRDASAISERESLRMAERLGVRLGEVSKSLSGNPAALEDQEATPGYAQEEGGSDGE